jgi:hypothetical protein
MSAVIYPSTSAVDLAAVKHKQRLAWSAGNHAVVGTTLQIVGESLCEALDLRAGERAPDFAAATPAAARRWCDVVSTDYVPSLQELGRTRANTEGLQAQYEQAVAENLRYTDQGFDVVMSAFSVMFTPDQDKAAHWLEEFRTFYGPMHKDIGVLMRRSRKRSPRTSSPWPRNSIARPMVRWLHRVSTSKSSFSGSSVVTHVIGSCSGLSIGAQTDTSSTEPYINCNRSLQ